MRVATGIISAVTAVLTVAGCGSPAEAPAAAGTIAVVASTNVWGSVVEAVGGDAVEVTSIITDPGADPHSYQDKPQDAAALAEARLAIYNGGGYDDFFAALADASGMRGRRIEAFALSGRSADANEHVWYDLPTVREVAGAVAAELGTIAPDLAGTFTANAGAFAARLDELAARTATIGTSRPRAKVVATEPIAAYLVEAAGLTDATPAEFAEAIEEETDPPAAAVAETTDLVTGKLVVALINNAQTETPVTSALKDSAARAGVPVVELTETLPEGVTSYVDWMARQVDALATI